MGKACRVQKSVRVPVGIVCAANCFWEAEVRQVVRIPVVRGKKLDNRRPFRKEILGDRQFTAGALVQEINVGLSICSVYQDTITAGTRITFGCPGAECKIQVSVLVGSAN